MRAVVWLLRAFLFFALFAFALNNQQETVVHWFFGFDWRAPMVVVVLAAFVAGCAIGVLAMTPAWWRQRRAARQQGAVPTADPQPAPAAAPLPSQFGTEAAFPPREGL